MPNLSNQMKAPAVSANQMAGQQALQMPKAPMNPGNMMGTGGGGRQFADMAAGPSSTPGV